MEYYFICINFIDCLFKMEHYFSYLIHRVKLVIPLGLYAWSFQWYNTVSVPLFCHKKQSKRLLNKFLPLAWNYLCEHSLKQNFSWDMCQWRHENSNKPSMTRLNKNFVRVFLCFSPTSKVFKYYGLKMVPDLTLSPLLWNKILKWRSYSDLLFLEDFVSNKTTIVLLHIEEGCG